jgi:hypothetical protein
MVYLPSVEANAVRVRFGFHKPDETFSLVCERGFHDAAQLTERLDEEHRFAAFLLALPSPGPLFALFTGVRGRGVLRSPYATSRITLSQ